MTFDAESLLHELTQLLQTYLADRAISHPAMIGIYSGGAWLAQRLHTELKLESPLGALNINFYRDDFAQSGLHTHERASHIPVDINGRDVILVDDIVYTGRTIRAAMNELFDYGRPKSITLVCLIARDGRELPIQPDVCALSISLGKAEVIKLRGPSPLSLERRVRATEIG
jgi:pyrimidine operon attenuation protein/uracil phosphoribosyltransferase